jgi:putative PIN family toxin of toxin-antitoxin system
VRVVFDTNVLVSALVIGGRASEAMARVIEGNDRLVISRPILHELLEVLASKFSRDAEQLARVAVLLSDIGDLVQTTEILAVLADDADNRILECAVEGHAELIVTGDRAMLQHKSFHGIPIVTLREYLSSPGE